MDKRVWWIVLLAAILIFWRIGHVDLTGDDAHYSVRAIGLADYMFANASFQSTPLQWFNQVPAWANWSFHDHPLTLFFIQHLFLKIKPSIFFAKLPYALMALGTLIITYLFANRLAGRRVALIATLFLALNSHFIWTGRVAYMEAGVNFFLALALYAFIRFLEDTKWWWRFGLALGLLLSAKFSTLFFIPTLLTYLLWQRRDVWREKKLYWALGLAWLVCLPVTIYNVGMYLDTGHFALQFVRLLHEPSPWHLSLVTQPNYVLSFIEIFKNLGLIISWPYLLLFFSALAYALYTRSQASRLLLVGVGWLTIQQVFIGQNGYLLSLYEIFIAILVALFLSGLFDWLRNKNFRHGERAAKTLFVLLTIYLLFFIINSHDAIRHLGRTGWAHSSVTSDNTGEAQLDDALDRIIATDKQLTFLDTYAAIKARQPRLKRYLSGLPRSVVRDRLAHSHVILIDGNISWFARVWLFERRRFYDNAPIYSLNESNFLQQLSIEGFYFIMAAPDGPLDAPVNRTTRAYELEKVLLANGAAPTLIYRDDGKAAFKIYHMDRSLPAVPQP